MNNIQCPICNRSTPKEYQEKHHLIPKSKKGKDTVLLCVDCADMIHQIFDNKELSKIFNTVEKLKSSPRMEKWINWISKKSYSFGATMARKKRV